VAVKLRGVNYLSKIIDPNEAAKMVNDNDIVWIVSAGGGINDPYCVLKSIEERFLQTGFPRNLEIWHSSGIGDKNGGGTDRFAHEGMVKRVIGSHWPWCPRISKMVDENKVEGYVLPQGVMVQLAREIAGGRPGLVSHVGLGTFIDPRLEGGRLNKVSNKELSEVIELCGKEWLFYKSFPIDITILRGTTADEDGNITFEHEGVVLEAISAVQAAKNSGGRVIAQVKRITQRGLLDPRNVKVPGILVDAVVVDSAQMQSAITIYDSTFTGETKIPLNEMMKIPFNERKIVARRAAMELYPHSVVNLGFGIADGVALVAAEEGISKNVTFTLEQGVIGGVPAHGINFGLSINPTAIIDEPYQFDWYDGGGLDIAFLSFAELDSEGNVNVSRFGDKIIGVGGFINISQNSKKVVFCGTFSASGLVMEVSEGRLKIVKEGNKKKFVNSIRQVSFSGKYARQAGQNVLYVTERAVFELKPEGLVLTEIAPGIDLENNILRNMDFKPIISKDIKEMDPRIFNIDIMGL
jgi:propionate CoA-transferase